MLKEDKVDSATCKYVLLEEKTIFYVSFFQTFVNTMMGWTQTRDRLDTPLIGSTIRSIHLNTLRQEYVCLECMHNKWHLVLSCLPEII